MIFMGPKFLLSTDVALELLSNMNNIQCMLARWYVNNNVYIFFSVDWN